MIYAYAASILLLGLGTQLAFALLDRRDRRRQVRRSVNLAEGIADERRLALVADDPTDDEATVELDPPVAPGTVIFRGRLVHEACLTWWLRGGTLRGGCAVHLTDDVQAGAV